ANLDRDSSPEIILVHQPSQCGSLNRSILNQHLHIHSDFVVYDLQEGKIEESCKLPTLYSMYFSDRYRSSLFMNSPIFTLSTYVAIATIAGYLGIVFLRYLATHKKIVLDWNRKR
ncbi:MAG: hypothetical protein AAGB19_16870, partial [Cyanobacteria bacterium P01_F01_bin.3]